MKLLLVVLFAIVATSAFQFNKRQVACTIPDNPFSSICVDLDGECWVGFVNNVSTVCRPGTYCTSPDTTPGTCKNILGGDCTEFPSGTVCMDPRKTRYATCNATTDICELDAAVSAANDGCTDNADCVGAMNCTNNLCVGLGINEPCDPALAGDDCAYGLWCAANSTCQMGAGIGDPCGSAAECPPGAVCPFGVDVCVDLFSGALDDSCNGLLGSGCGPGLICESDTCRPEITTQDFCDGPGLNCTAPQNCICISDQYRCFGGTEAINQACFDSRTAYLTCIRTNQCRNLDTALRSDAGKASCAYRMCEYTFACDVACTANSCSFQNDAALITLCNTASNTGTGSNTGTATGTSTDTGTGSGTGTGGADGHGYTLGNWLM